MRVKNNGFVIKIKVKVSGYYINNKWITNCEFSIKWSDFDNR